MDFATATPAYVAKPLQLHPFRAIMLSPERVGDPASLRALARPYRDVADRLTEWIRQGRALEETEPAVYIHEYSSGTLSVRGVTATLDLARRANDPAKRAVLPHEGIHPDQVHELAHRMKEMRLNPAPILLAHEGTPQFRTWLDEQTARTPDWTYDDRASQHQRLWAVRDDSAIAQLNSAIVHSQALLADGHHRYAAYLELQAEHGHADPGWNHGLAMLVDQRDTPLFLGAIHRTFPRLPLARFIDLVSPVARIEAGTQEQVLARLSPTTCAATDGGTWISITPDLTERPLVEWLHDGPLTPEVTGQAEFHHTVAHLLDHVSDRVTGVVLPSLDFASVTRVLESGRLLPEKATSFQPKPSLGVLMRPVHD